MIAMQELREPPGAGNAGVSALIPTRVLDTGVSSN